MPPKQTFNGHDEGAYALSPDEKYKEPCQECHGVGHVHCPDCKKEERCSKCGGSGKAHVYQGSIYKIWWNLSPHEICGTSPQLIKIQ